jgi:asparagine synthetase B (glutamine-hydrolysing)
VTVLAGTCGTAQSEAGRAWLRRTLVSDRARPDEIEFVDEPALDLQLAYRKPRPGFAGAEFGRSPSGQVCALLVGLVHGHTRDAASLATAYEAEGEAALEKSLGAFAVVLIDLRAQRLLLVRGAGGQRSLFYAEAGEGMAFASDGGALRQHPEVDQSWDTRAMLDQLCYGVIWGERTLQTGVRLILPGQLGTWSARDRRFSLHPFAALPDGDELPDMESAVEVIDAALHAAMQRSASGEQPAALCLSAGLDSRVLLAVGHHAGVVPDCVTNGIEGGIELRLARRMCDAVGAAQQLCLIDADIVDGMREGAQAVAACTDGEGDVKNAMMLYVGRRYRDALGLNRVIRGHGGELMKLSTAYGFAMSETLATSHDHALGLKHISKQLSVAAPPSRVAEIVSKSLAEQLVAEPNASLAESYRALVSDTRQVGQCASLLFLTQYNGRNTVNAMRCIRESVEVTQPFLDEDVALAILRAPVSTRIDAELQTRIIARNSPALVKVPNSALRVPLDAGPTHRRVVDVVQRVARRLGFGKVDVPEKWLVARLDELFESVLLDPRSLERDWVNPDSLKTLASSADNHANAALLGRFTMLELSARHAEDESPV